MRFYTVRARDRSRPGEGRSRAWQRSRPRHSRPANGTYRDSVATSPGVNLQRFARFTKRVLGEARDRGLTDSDIEKATGVRASTFHRWQRGEVAPQINKVNAFCDGLGVPRRTAYLALGITEGRDDPEPEPVIDPEVRRILRILADPSVSDAEKEAIRQVLRVIGPRARGART